MLRFRFPEAPPQRIKNKLELKNYLQQTMLQEGINDYCSYKIRCSDKYLYAKCSSCISCISFKYNTEFEIYELRTNRPFHNHKRIKVMKSTVVEQIRGLPDFFTLSVIKNIIVRKYQISLATFYRYYSEAKELSSNFSQFVNNLEEKDFEGYCWKENASPDEVPPDLLLLTTPHMKENFQKYGETVGFDLTYNIIREKPQNGVQFSIGVFAGLDKYLKITPFGVAIVAYQTKQIFKRLMLKFFQFMRGSPSNIITDQQLTIKLALDQLKKEEIWVGNHYNDSFHVLRNIRPKLREKEKFSVFTSLINATDRLKFERIARECSFTHESDLKVMQKFLCKKREYCFAYLQPSFLGTSCSTSFVQKINDLLKTQIPMSRKYYSVAWKIINYLEKFSQNKKDDLEKVAFENILGLAQLKNLRLSVGKKILRILLQKISKTTKLLISATSSSKFKVTDENDLIYQLQKIADLKLKCSCEWDVKTGVPCEHKLKLILLNEESIIPHIDARWKIDYIPAFENREYSVQINRPRKTRRRGK